MKVLFASSEIYPYAKTGGLADVSNALPLALSSSVEISRVMPFYSFMKESTLHYFDTFTTHIGEQSYAIKIFTQTKNKVITYFIQTPLLSTTANLYGGYNTSYSDNDIRFALFSKVIVSLARMLKIDILHLNDWHTALSALYIKELNLEIKTVLTIHNLAYQGIFAKSTLTKVALDSKYFTMQGLEFYDKVNFLKAGILYSDAITTVSPSYANEILTPEFGCGLEGFLSHHKDKLQGILNGINVDVYNPLKDKMLSSPFNHESLQDKHKNKVTFIQNSTLKDPRVPLFIMVTRLVEQKGLPLLLSCIEEILNLKVNFILLGEGDEEIYNQLTAIDAKHKNFEFIPGYDESLSHQLYAASDFLLMPSVFEPSGLNQFIAMHYGSIPIVHAVGGLKDSVHENSKGCGRGIIFDSYTKEAFMMAMQRALALKKNSKRFTSIKQENMQCDVSFKTAALQYLKLYQSLI